MINFFAIFASKDGKQLLSHLYVAIFQFCAEKCPKDADPHNCILSDALFNDQNVNSLSLLMPSLDQQPVLVVCFHLVMHTVLNQSVHIFP